MKKIIQMLKTHGVGHTADLILNRLLIFLFQYQCLQVIVVRMASLVPVHAPEGFTSKVLSAVDLVPYLKDPDLQLTASFLADAQKKGDQCLAVFKGDQLASYGWYSANTTVVDDHLVITFGGEYIYMYNGFTHDSFRGLRLHAYGMTEALRYYTDNGFKGLVSFVDSRNEASLKSCWRMGYQDIGLMRRIKLFGHALVHHSHLCLANSVIFIERGPTSGSASFLYSLPPKISGAAVQS